MDKIATPRIVREETQAPIHYHYQLEARLPSGPAGTGPQVKDGRGEEWFEEWRRKYGSEKGEPTGVDRDASDVEGSERGTTGLGKRRPKRARGAGLQGPTGNWGEGRGRQESERRDGQ